MQQHNQLMHQEKMSKKNLTYKSIFLSLYNIKNQTKNNT